MKSTLVRLLAVSLVLTIALMPGRAIAAGDNPVRVRAPFVPFTITGVCPFDVYWDALADNGYYIVHVFPDSTRYILTGVLKSRLTNVQTGKYVVLNNSAAYTQVFYNDGSSAFSASGPQLWMGVPDLPPLVYVTGRVTLSLDAGGAVTGSSAAGNVRDVCAMLSN